MVGVAENSIQGQKIEFQKPADSIETLRKGENSEARQEADEENERRAKASEQPDIPFIERTSRSALIEQNRSAATDSKNEPDGSKNAEQADAKDGDLTDEDRAQIKEETGWSDEIVNAIKTKEQYEILKNAGLKEAEVNGRKCLVKENIDLDYTDADGISNRERIARGLAPLDSNGKPIELHHLGQKKDSPLVELTIDEHRSAETGADKIWHDKNKETEVHGEGNTWKDEREAHWKTRSDQLSGGSNI